MSNKILLLVIGAFFLTIIIPTHAFASNTFGYESSTATKRASVGTTIGTTCATTANAITDFGFAQMYLGDSDDPADCVYSGTRFDISSIPSGATITQVNFKGNVTISTNTSSRTCEFVQLDHPQSGWTNSTTERNAIIAEDRSYGTWTECRTTGSKTITLNANATADLQSALSSGIFEIGHRYTTHDRISAGAIDVEIHSPQLQVTYTLPQAPNRITNLSGSGVNTTAITLTWTNSTSSTFQGVTISRNGTELLNSISSLSDYFPFDGNTTNIQNSTHAITILGNENYGNGSRGTGFFFNGTTKLQLPYNSNVNFNSSFTLSVFVKPDSTTARDVIFTTRSGYGVNGFSLVKEVTNQKLTVHFGSADTQLQGSVLTSNNWHHVALVKNSTHITLFLNGTQDAVISLGSQIFDVVGNSRNFGDMETGNYWHGFMDEAKIFNSSLTDVQILNINQQTLITDDAFTDIGLIANTAYAYSLCSWGVGGMNQTCDSVTTSTLVESTNQTIGAEGYFKAGRWYSSNTYSSIAPTTQEASANVLRAFPFIVGNEFVADRIQFEVTEAVSSTNCNVGIYASDSDLYPTTLVVDGGQQPTSSAGLKTTTINSTLTSNKLYWLAYNCNGTPTLTAIPPAGLPNVLGYSGSGGLGTQGTGWTVANTYASTLPSTYPVNGTILSNTNGILIQIRIS